jgi:hypothetical protein
MLKAMDVRNLSQPTMMALRTKDRQSKDTAEPLKFIKVLNTGLHMKNWRVLYKQPEPKGKCLILLVDWDSSTKAIRDWLQDLYRAH